MSKRKEFRRHARSLRSMRRDLIHDAGRAFCREFVRDELVRDYIASVARRGVRIPRSMRTEAGR